MHELSAESVAVILDPTGPATLAIVNYSPVQILVHAVMWSVFGSETWGHHVLNVVLHALASGLLVALLLSCGIPAAAAVAGGALFLLHPANVEAVAWVSQLKSTLSLVLSLAALLAWRSRPGLASLCFALALLTKATAAFALPVALLLDWTQGREAAAQGSQRQRSANVEVGPLARLPAPPSREAERSAGSRPRWAWLALWVALFAAYAAAEFAAHQRSGAAEALLYDTPLVLARTVIALAGRYLVMAATGLGVSAFHEPEPAASWLDPWWLASLVALGLLGWRLWVVAWRRELEVAWWVWAVVSFAPISQIFPFLYPMADRYLYFILPGLLGGACLAGREALARLAPQAERRRTAQRVALGVAVALAVFFAVRSLDRAALWRSNALLMADAAANYPEGKAGLLQRAKRAALVGDASSAVAALRRASERGYNRFEQLATDPGWNSIRNEPGFRALERELAGQWIEKTLAKAVVTQGEHRAVAHAHVVRRELDAAVEAMRRAVEQGGPATEEIRAELAAIEAALRSGQTDRIRLRHGAGP